MTAAVQTSDARPALPDGYRALLSRLGSAARVDDAWSELVDDAVRVWSRPGFDTLVSLPHLRFEPYEHQVRAAQVALRRMRGRAVLADEVGLGKTIEAGLVLAELRLRRMAAKVLVLTPAGLTGQWREELDRKFALPSVLAQGRGWADGADRPVVIASLAAARRDPLKSALTGAEWDLVVVDEAQRVKNPRSAQGRLVRGLRSRHLLLLTATPVENRLDDLFELVSLVAPGLLGTAAEFRARHGARAAAAVAARDVEGLRERMRKVMVRNRRSEVAVQLPQRLAETVRVTPQAAEAQLYAEVGARIRERARGATSSRLLALRGASRLAGSSPAALAGGLATLGWADLAERAAAIERPAKTGMAVDLLARRVAAGEKVVVFTAYRHTLAHLAAAVERAGIPAAVYHGGLGRRDKERAIAAFAGDAHPVLLTTEAAGEGRNLQFCHVLVNYDLPWNPMQIEQRLGRLHRIGQQHDVVLTNLVARGTIEERILHVLESKINLFELVVGELDMIIGRVSDELDFEARVFATYVESGDDAEFGAALAAFGDELAVARRDYLASRQATDALVGELS
jgi:SNF2 family DNA or RNA helicase